MRPPAWDVPRVSLRLYMSTTPNRRSRRPRRGSQKSAIPQDATHSTSRLAYAETRRWLLAQHGPVCAYCGGTHAPRDITLDHVTPRKGQKAYDRRDNLVLACKRCNTAKADKPFLVYLLAQRARAMNLLRYGRHLSEGILDLLRHMAGGDLPELATGQIRPRERYGAEDDGESPYLESPYRRTA